MLHSSKNNVFFFQKSSRNVCVDGWTGVKDRMIQILSVLSNRLMGWRFGFDYKLFFFYIKKRKRKRHVHDRCPDAQGGEADETFQQPT